MSITYLDISSEPKTDDPVILVEHWRAEVARWLDEYDAVDDAILGFNPFRDGSTLDELRDTLAAVSANLRESTNALIECLNGVDIRSKVKA